MQSIVIVSADMSGPMAAAYLARHLPRDLFSITLIQTGTIERASWCATAHHDLRRFNRALGIKEAAFIKHCRATFKLGEHHIGFVPPRDEIGDYGDYIVPYCDYGMPLNGAAFHHAVIHLNAFDGLQSVEGYSLPARAIREHKFMPPDAKGRPVLSGYDYGYHLDAARYADMLSDHAATLGATVFKNEVTEVLADGPNISAITLDNGQTLSADLFIDASGVEAVLASRQAARNWDDWSGYGFAQSYSHAVITPSAPLPSATAVTANTNGWTLTVPLQNITHSTAFHFDATATPIAAGRQVAPWVGNVLTLGGTCASVEPLYASTLRMMQADIERLVTLMPPQLSSRPERAEYNRLSSSVYDRQRDFLMLHYKTANTAGKAWQDRRDMTLTDTAQNKLDLFSARGRMAVLDEDHYFREFWIPMLLGHGLTPARLDPMVAGIEPTKARAELADLAALIAEAVSQMPPQSAFIKRHCASEDLAYV